MTDYRLETSWAVGLLVVEAGKIVDSAPIFKWVRGHTLEFVIAWYRKKGAFVSCEPLDKP